MKQLFTLCIFFSIRLIAITQPLPETVGNPMDSAFVSTHTGWTNQGILTFTGTAQVQNTQPSNYQDASGGGNVFFTNTPGTFLEISGFDTTFQPPDDIEIHFGMFNSVDTNLNELLFEYSTLTSKNILKNIYPLPAKDRLNIQIQSNKTEKGQISVTNTAGRTLITKSVSLAEGNNNSFINLQSLSNGVYLLKVVTSEITETRKIIVGQ